MADFSSGLYPVQRRNAAALGDDDELPPASPRLISKKRNVQLQDQRNAVLDDSKTMDDIVRRIQLSGIDQYHRATAVTAKIFWACLVVLAVTMLTYGFVKGVQNYTYSPIATTYTVNTPPSIDFPDVYICMGNPLRRSFIQKHPAAVKGVSFLFLSLVTKDARRRRKRSSSDQLDPVLLSDNNDEENGDETLLQFDSLLDRNPRAAADEFSNDDEEAWKTGRVDFYRFLSEGGFQITDTFVSCSFNGYETKMYNCSDIVTNVIDPNYFLCYTVHVPEDQKQVKSGKGLSLILNTQLDDYPRGGKVDMEANKIAGIYVSVTDRLDPTNWNKATVAPGTYTKIDLAATRVHLINLERGALIQPCIAEGQYMFKVFNASYSRTACQMDCLLDTYVRYCDCILLMDKSIVKEDILKNVSFCSFNRSQTCVQEKIIDSEPVLKEIEGCRKLCHPPCESTRYDMRASHAKLTDGIRHTLTTYGAKNASIPASELVKLDIAFKRIEYAELTQSESKTLAQMIADFGGNLNLWFGASMIALMETIVAVTGSCCYYLCFRTRVH